MSLVDKLEGVHVGDLLQLEGANTNKVGYVANYDSSTVTLSNTNTRDKKTGEIRNVSFLNQYAKEKVATVPLKWFDTYNVLEKYVAPENHQSE